MKHPGLLFSLGIFYCVFSGMTNAKPNEGAPGKNEYIVEEFAHKDLASWKSYGLGGIEANHGQTVIYERAGSLGFMLVSPRTYTGNIIVSYDVMALNAATVLILELAAHNTNDFDLDLPLDYDGNVKYLFQNINMYMFAFHNAAHNKPGPFVRKYPEPGNEPLAEASKNSLETGKYHHVEMGIENGKIWFRTDGEKILQYTDEEYYKGGKIILRIRGTGPETASCLIRNLSIHSETK